MTAKYRLTTERLLLRGLIPADTSFISELMGDSEVRRFLGGIVPLARREAAISSYFVVGEKEMAWMVETKVSRQPIGLIFLSKHRDGEDFELSYQFHPESWGNGYATEATKRVLDHALRQLMLSRVIAETQSANSASRRLLETLGMNEVRRVERFGAEQIIYTS